jgi:hypothetical protein
MKPGPGWPESKTNMKKLSHLKKIIGAHRRWVVGAALAAIGLAAVAGFTHLLPRVPGGLANGRSAAVWYFQNDQWRADLRTALAVARYVINPGTETTPAETNATNGQVARGSTARSEGV